ncbi:PTS transporter subunit EIIB [Bacillus sp. SL00103]
MAQEIVKLIGGTENISQSWHCITRLRFNLNNESKVKVEELKTLDGVFRCTIPKWTISSHYWSKVAEIYEEIDHLVGHSSNDSTPVKKLVKDESNRSRIRCNQRNFHTYFTSDCW